MIGVGNVWGALRRLFGPVLRAFAESVANVVYTGLGSLAMCGALSRWFMLGTVLASAIGLAACGGGGSTTKSGSTGDPPGEAAQAPPSKSDSGRVAIRVGSSVITVGMLDHWMAVQEGSEPLAPPRFTACVAHLQATGGTSGSPSATGAAKPSEAQLKASCEQSYQELRVLGLDRYIVGAWVIGGARELGVAISHRELERKLAPVKKIARDPNTRYGSYLAKSGRTIADVEYLVQTDLDSEAIRTAFKRRVGPITAARVRNYYERHKSLYFTPEKRDLGIAATRTKAEALALRRKVAAGESFARVVKGSSWAQPVSSNNGVVLGLESGFYHEQSLNHAIFTAKPGVLTGPINTVIGYYVFDVKRIHPADQKPLSAVAPSLNAMLPGVLAQEALVNYIKRWRAKWTPRTDCSPGYVVQKCRQFEASAAAPEDPYTLN